MKITTSDVDYVARLANLEVSEDEKAELAAQLTRIVDYVDQLNRLDLESVPPTAHIDADTGAGREDLPLARVGSADAAKPAKLFKVPRVITER